MCVQQCSEDEAVVMMMIMMIRKRKLCKQGLTAVCFFTDPLPC